MTAEYDTKFNLTDAITELEMAIASLNGLAEAIQNNDLDGRQAQCGRTSDRLRTLMRQMQDARASSQRI